MEDAGFLFSVFGDDRISLIAPCFRWVCAFPGRLCYKRFYSFLVFICSSLM